LDTVPQRLLLDTGGQGSRPNAMNDRILAFAPGSIGNVGPGLDILGLAVAGRGDVVVAQRRPRDVVILDPGHADLPTDPDRHSAGIAAREVLARAGVADEMGVALTVRKGLPLLGGQGGSAASAVAAAVATNGLLENPLWPTELIGACLVAEERVSGRHADNVAPSLLGGLVLLRMQDPLEIIKLPVPQHLRLVLAQPDYRISTAEGRSRLPATVPLATALHQAAQVAALVAACYQRDLGLFGRALDDRIAEPARIGILPGFAEAKAAAIEAGAMGCSVSGSGPTIFALAHSDTVGEQVAEAIRTAYQSVGHTCTTRVAKVDHLGARLIREESPVPQGT